MFEEDSNKIETSTSLQYLHSKIETTMLVFKNCLLLYGGLGCERNLSWAKLDFATMRWDVAH